MKFFPAESESAIEDAAKWSSSINLNVAAFRRDVSIGTTTTTTTTGISSLIHADGTEMPFDMDLPLYPLSSLGISSRMNQGLVGDLISPTTLSTAASMDENDQTETNRLSSLVMDSIDTARIPCPRICGATFSAGVGGLAGTIV